MCTTYYDSHRGGRLCVACALRHRFAPHVPPPLPCPFSLLDRSCTCRPSPGSRPHSHAGCRVSVQCDGGGRATEIEELVRQHHRRRLVALTVAGALALGGGPKFLCQDPWLLVRPAPPPHCLLALVTWPCGISRSGSLIGIRGAQVWDSGRCQRRTT